ncbi:hypothetical protein DFP72DRAFT_632751 [Ephemerocybe angulata]|uniref:Inhibitor I9 domain-containing protein n=1 Tax=Ephemerocybe angulata TaxID=980116 RepID=A0A8H6ICU0_9AGAR|nr:hypothetical protein DFP72DRAFT_632751 [Tulosesus angulatus]
MADSAPTIDMARTTEGNKKETTTYIITLKKGVDKDAHFAALRPHLFDSEIKDVFKHLDAYSGTFSEATLDFLRASDDVERIKEDAETISLFQNRELPRVQGGMPTEYPRVIITSIN